MVSIVFMRLLVINTSSLSGVLFCGETNSFNCFAKEFNV